MANDMSGTPCPNCGYANSAGTQTCPSCGHPLPTPTPSITRDEILKHLVFYPLNVAGILALLGWVLGKPNAEIAAVAGVGWMLGLTGGLIRMAIRRFSKAR